MMPFLILSPLNKFRNNSIDWKSVRIRVKKLQNINKRNYKKLPDHIWLMVVFVFSQSLRTLWFSTGR